MEKELGKAWRTPPGMPHCSLWKVLQGCWARLCLPGTSLPGTLAAPVSIPVGGWEGVWPPANMAMMGFQVQYLKALVSDAPCIGGLRGTVQGLPQPIVELLSP